MQLISDLFAAQAEIPADNTCKGRNVSPSLRLIDAPPDAASLAIIMHDPDAPNGDFLHWTMWNIPPSTAVIEEGSVPAGVRQGTNDFGAIGYGGPCPPSGTHRYVFELYALDTMLDIAEGADRATLTAALQGHTRTIAQLTGTVTA